MLPPVPPAPPVAFTVGFAVIVGFAVLTELNAGANIGLEVCVLVFEFVKDGLEIWVGLAEPPAEVEVLLTTGLD
jgi:hypothetical protein